MNNGDKVKNGLRTYLVPWAIIAGFLLGIFVFWQSVEAPQRAVRAVNEAASTVEPIAIVPTVLSSTASVSSTLGISRTLSVSPTLNVFQVPSATPIPVLPPGTGNPQDVRVPILMYHRIDRLPPNPDELRKSLSISPTDFDLEVRFLKDRGFTSLSLYDVYNGLQGKRRLPAKPIVLTFDDGYVDNYNNAFPVLTRYGFSGTFFIITDFMGTGDYMNWDQLKEMASSGMKIEAHGRTHADLTRMNAAAVQSQAKGAKEAIQTRIGITPMFYSYPSGIYNKDVSEIIKANGFLGAVTTAYGSDHSLQKAFDLKRVRIDGRESFAQFARKVGESP